MAIQSSYHTISEQVISFNNNLIDTLSKINQLITSPEPSVTVNVTDGSGIVSQYSLPSFGYLKSEIDRLNNNINAIYNVDTTGAVIQTSAANKYKKVVTVDLNREPNDVNGLNTVTSFVSSKNWFFEGLMNPELSVELDLSGKIEDNVRKVLSRRYIIEFEKDINGNFTPTGQAALNSYNTLFRNNSSIVLTEFETWQSTTPGVLDAGMPTYDEQLFDLQPNLLEFSGVFSVLKTEEDLLNRKLFYHLDKLDYTNNKTNETRQLSIGDELIINVDKSSTRYRIVEVSTVSSSPKVRLERIEGNEPIAVGFQTLKFYSAVLYTKKVRVSVGYNERNVIFIKPLNMDNFLLSRNWSLGTGFWTNDLRLSSDDSFNGSTMEQYYIDNVYDYGQVIKDLVSKKTPNTLAATPNRPALINSNFKVVQINKHLTDNSDSTLLKNKNNQQKSLKSEIEQINQAITDKNKQLQITRFTSDAARKQFENELDRLNKTKDTKSKALSSLVSEILDISNSSGNTVDYKFAIRGFWEIPAPVITRGTKPQEVIQFKIEYRYLSVDGKETPIETFNLSDNNGATNQTNQVAAFSNWVSIKSDVRGRTFDAATGDYFWDKEDISNPDKVNINQIDIPMQYNERVELRVKSISEVGWPESPVESEWSDTISIDFPVELSNNLNQTSAIITDANKEDILTSIESDLNAKGLDVHLSETTVINNKTYLHNSASIVSGFKDTNGIALDLFEYLSLLENRIKSLESQIKMAKGELEVIVFRNSDQFVVKNGSELTFTVDCEDYLDSFTDDGVPTGRVYSNNIYSIKDFLLKVKNKSSESPLGLLSNRTYVNATNTDVYNQVAPQIFWVNDQNELIFSNVSGSTKTQLDNQFLWMINYDNLNQTSITKLSDNIGNNFITNNSNSITNILSSSDFNVGYSENSVLSFIGNNNSLLDVSKWIDSVVSVSSTTKLLTSVHPSVPKLDNIVETNAEKKRALDGGSQNDINIPINIYFKMNALDPSQSGLNYQYINLNSAKTTIRHTKKVKFLLETDVDNRPFVFTIKFIINRNKVVLNKVLTPVSVVKTLQTP
jgi:hypothetical protein